MRDGRMLYERGWGQADLERPSPVTAASVFRAGSITKQFVAAAVLALAEDGRLSLDDTLDRYLPDFPRASSLSLRQLLNHTSGIWNFTNDRFFEADSRLTFSTEQMIAYIARHDREVSGPRSGWEYSDSNYLILGAIVERVSAQPLETYLRTRLFERAGLKSAVLDDDGRVIPNRASGYVRVQGRFERAMFTSMSHARGAGALATTAGDLARWQAALLGGKVLTPRSVAMMLEPARLADGRIAGRTGAATYAYGLGTMLFCTDGRAASGHAGTTSGYRSMMLTYADEGVSVVVLMNGGGQPYPVADALDRIVLDPSRGPHRPCVSPQPDLAKGH
jgi:D-alanyl-D-alanine carboxypeptidase